MLFRLFTGLTLLALPLMVISSLVSSSAAALDYTQTALNVAAAEDTLTGEKLKPAECNGLTLGQDFIAGSGVFSDTSGSSSLLIGSSGVDTIYGRDGTDCLVALGGDDSLDGGDGADVCLGSDGADEFSDCETCYGGGGADTDLTATCTISDSVESP